MICATCSTPIPDDSAFCMHCGSDVSDPSRLTTASLTDVGVANILRLLREDTKGEFQIEEEIGRGGMAVVYLATEVRLHRKVALKVLPPELTFGPGATQRFEREARTAAGLDHPHIIPIYRISPEGRLFWYAMKFLEGHTLDRMLKDDGPFTLETLLPIMRQVGEALDYAHRRNVVHRDIKPSNIMVDQFDRAVVTDFGIAKELSAGTFTASGSVLGTPYYMSPEQWSGKSITGASDQYATGVMAYQLLAGRLPFEAETAVELLQKHCYGKPMPLAEVRPDLPEYTCRAVEKALAKEPQHRFASLATFVKAMQEPWRDDATTEIVLRPSQRLIAAALRRKGKLLRWAAVAMVAVGALTGAGYVVWHELTGGAAAPDTTNPIEQWLQGPDGGEQQNTAVITPIAPESSQVRGDSVIPAVEVPEPAVLAISGLPSRGRLLVDGEARESTEVELAPGMHRIRLEAPGFQPVVDSIEFDAGAKVVYPFVARPIERPAPRTPEPQARPPADSATADSTSLRFASLLVQVEGPGGPDWAEIFVDDMSRRTGRNMRDSRLTPGTHVIRVAREGFVGMDTIVTLVAGVDTTIVMRIRPGGQ